MSVGGRIVIGSIERARALADYNSNELRAMAGVPSLYAESEAKRDAWNVRRDVWLVLGASARTAHCLASAEVSNPLDPRLMDDKWLLRLPNFGRKSLRELRELIGRVEPPPRLEKSWQTINPLICTFGEWRPGEYPR